MEKLRQRSKEQGLYLNGTTLQALDSTTEGSQMVLEIQEQGMVECACNPSTQGNWSRRIQGQSRLQSETLFQKPNKMGMGAEAGRYWEFAGRLAYLN